MNAHAVWTHPALIDKVLYRRDDGNSDITLRVSPLDDARRTLRLEQTLRALPGVKRVAIDPPSARVQMVWNAQVTPLPSLLQAFESAGCTAQPLARAEVDTGGAVEVHDALKRLLVAGMCAMQVMSYALVIYLGVVDSVDVTTRNLFRWLCLLTSVPLLFYSARPFFLAAAAELRTRRAGINVPVAIALAVVSAASTFNTIRGQGEIYFDSLNMLVFLLLLARYVELRARHRNSALGDAVIDAAPLLARRRSSDGSVEMVPAVALLPGDIVSIHETDTIPADGVLLSACAQVDEALLSGESRPRARVRGEHLIAGSVMLSGPVEMRVERSGESTTAARLGHTARRARMARTTPRGHDRVIQVFVVGMLALASLTSLGWLLFDPARAFDAAVAVLVVACPCAFALTGPATTSRALAVLARRGVLVARADVLAALGRVDAAVFDKTGTLAAPHFAFDGATAQRDVAVSRAWALAGALARESAHPMARALARTALSQTVVPPAENVAVSASAGIRGRVENINLRLGRAEFAGAPSFGKDQGSLLWLADDDGPIASFAATETVRPGTRAVMDRLRHDGIALTIASGDDADRVSAMAAQLGIASWHARQMPDDKLHLLRQLHAAGHVTLAVGDGSNDAPVLAGADVSAALATGTGLAQSQADLLLLNDDLQGLLDARDIAVQVDRIVAQNRRWSLSYNVCAIPFAAVGFVPPWLAVIGMSLSSLFVVLNALRVGRISIRAPHVTRESGLPA